MLLGKTKLTIITSLSVIYASSNYYKSKTCQLLKISCPPPTIISKITKTHILMYIMIMTLCHLYLY